MVDIKEFPKEWFKKAKISKKFDVNIKSILKLSLDYLEKNGLIKAGFLNKILWVGFNGIVDLKMEEEYQK